MEKCYKPETNDVTICDILTVYGYRKWNQQQQLIDIVTSQQAVSMSFKVVGPGGVGAGGAL